MSIFSERLIGVFPDLKVISEEGKYAIVENKYGKLRVRKDSLLRGSYPKINSAINKTEYFKKQLLEKYPNSLDNLEILSEFKGYKTALLCKDQFGLVKISPQSLMDGKLPNTRSAIDYKQYLREKLKFIHKDFGYDFEIINNDYSYLICPKHGKIKIQNKYLLLGYICPICKNELGSNLLYLIQLYDDDETFYKVGISRRTVKDVLRYKDCKALGYKIKVIYEIEFNNSGDSKVLEQQVKDLIKKDLYTPLKWSSESLETFLGDSLQDVKRFIKDYIHSCNRLKIEN